MVDFLIITGISFFIAMIISFYWRLSDAMISDITDNSQIMISKNIETNRLLLLILWVLATILVTMLVK